jgi:hypothetical protein
MHAATIAAVIEKFGVYTAALEREYIRSQQRPAVELKVRVLQHPGRPKEAKTLSRRQKLIACLQSKPAYWWTSKDVQAETGMDPKCINSELHALSQEGKILRRKEVSSVGHVPIRYRAKG